MKVRRNVMGWFAAVVVCLLAVCAAPVAQAIQAEVGDLFSLNSLIEEDSTIEIGDKIFSDFAFDSTSFSVDTILVKVIQVDGNWGLSFRDEWSAFAAEGDGSATKGFRLEFSVAVAPEHEELISDVHLRFNGSYAGDAFSEVTEQVFDTGYSLINQEDLVVSNPPPVFEDVYWLAQPTKEIKVVKDVILYAEGHRRLSHASISTIDQTFSQIPEPGTVLLVASGLFGLLLVGRRSHK